MLGWLSWVGKGAGFTLVGGTRVISRLRHGSSHAVNADGTARIAHRAGEFEGNSITELLICQWEILGGQCGKAFMAEPNKSCLWTFGI
jgi:hypothetical protein